MTRSLFVAIVVAAGVVAGASAQTTSQAPTAKNDKPTPIVLNGCVATSEPGVLVVQDEKKGRFELTGQKLDIYIGKRVEVRGRSESGLHITTGLYPSANVAAQAGIDPVRAAQANMPGSPDHPSANMPLPKVTVTQVKILKGAACK